MNKPILLLLCVLFCAPSSTSAQSSGLRWMKPDSVILFQPGTERVLRLTVSNLGSKLEMMDIRLEGDTAHWKLIATERGYVEDIVMMPAEKVWVDVKFASPFLPNSSVRLIADGSVTDDTLRLSASSNSNIAAWDPRRINFALSQHATDTIVKATLRNLWFGSIQIDALVIEGDAAWKVNTPMPLTLSPGEYHEIPITYLPSEPGTHVAILITKTSGISDTLHLQGTASRTLKGIYWSSDTMKLVPASCTESTTQVVELNNDGISDALIENVSIVGPDAGYFRILSSSPPNKLQDFVLAPAPQGNGVQYLIEFGPDGDTKPHGADLVVRTSSGAIEKVMLIGMVPVSDVVYIDTTLTKLQVGADHTITLQLTNLGNAAFRSSNVYWSGDLDATLSGLASGIEIMPGITKDVNVTLRSDVAGIKSKVFHINGGDCDQPFEIRISAQFGDLSKVEIDHKADIQLTQSGHYIIIAHNGSHPLPYRIVDASGRVIASGRAWQHESVDVTQLSSGAYLFTVGDDHLHTLKFLRH